MQNNCQYLVQNKSKKSAKTAENLHNNGALCFAYWSGSSRILKSANGVLLLNTYTEIAMSFEKATNKLRLFADGIKVLEQTITAAPTPSTTAGLVIGLGGGNNGDGKTRGLLDSFRLTKGVCRYKDSYTPHSSDYDAV